MNNLNAFQKPPPSNSMRTPKKNSKTKVIGFGSLYPLFRTFSTPNSLKSGVSSVPNMDSIINSTKTKLTYDPYNSSINTPPPLPNFCNYQEGAYWPKYRGNTNISTGISSYPGPTDSLFNILPPIKSALSTPVIDKDGNIYFCSYNDDYDTYDIIYSFGPSLGLRWVQTLSNFDFTQSTITIGCDGTLYIPSSSALFALNSGDGSAKWIKNIGPVSNPIIIREIIYVANPIGNIYGFNSNGDQVFFTNIGNYNLNGFGSNSDDEKNILYITGLSNDTFDIYLFAINLNNKNILWNTQLLNFFFALYATPSIYGQYIFVTAGNLLYKININTGVIENQANTLSNTGISSPIVTYNYVYVGTESNGLLKFNKTDLTQVTFGNWPYIQQNNDVISDFSKSNQVMDSNGRIYISDNVNGILSCINSSDASVVWITPIAVVNPTFPFFTSPIIGSNGLLFLATSGGLFSYYNN